MAMECSLYISDLMDHLGYSYDMIRYRQQTYSYYDRLARSSIHTRVTTGGKGEGTNFYYESDIDYIHIVKDALCAQKPKKLIHKKNISLFKVDMQATPPGYTKLKLIKCDAESYRTSIMASLTLDNGERYLSSDLFTHEIRKYVHEWCLRNEIKTHPARGPSTPTSLGNLNIDNVRCFRCLYHKHLQAWASRRRPRGWPSREHVHDICDIDGHIVPVGFKGSPTQYLEWRICYTSAELYLMKILNETQLKVYIILKNISKSVLKPISDDITSYIMKNIFLWQCETLGIDMFAKHTLTARTEDCLRYLKRSVENNCLPSYMIPERNLLAGKLNINQRRQLISLINDSLELGNIIPLSDMLRAGVSVMFDAPDVLKEFGRKRKRVEMLVLMKKRIILEMQKTHETETETEQILILSKNKDYLDTVKEIEMLINFDSSALKQEGKFCLEVIAALEGRLTKLLS
ncbi:uncharacterized protein LOC123531255 [Mercenaria mercenaria]|uniref:uncharacterized protein LOC123531255 n=1 Tax=Mercenaria mercenaria TaxID=6596 RepID=UPI00234EBE22|nr:uncharacterized protein LOC123531255 [Mercenaria mercenaria]